MRILEWTENAVAGLSRLGVTRILTESDEEGRIVREIGLSGDVVRYIASSVDPMVEQRGFFDGHRVAAN